jgi:hypothetical protein
MGLTLGFAPLLLAAATSNAPACTPIAGWDELWTADTRVVVIGEIHGSNEVPAVFADAVCLTAQSRRVVVALEQPASDQAAIDAFIASDGGPDAQAVFMRALMWNMPTKDGRSSQAYFRLFETLRQMRAAGRIEGVVAFQPVMLSAGPSPPAQYEKAMAELLLSGLSPNTVVVALVGNVHAMRTAVPREPPYLPMAAHLPPAQTVTLNVIPNGGESWNCVRGADSCKPSPMGTNPNPRERGIERGRGADDPYSGVLYLGTLSTASPPQTAL